MKANIYYSTDSTFTTSTMVDYVTGDTSANHYLDRDTFTTVRAGYKSSFKSWRKNLFKNLSLG